MNFLIHRTMTGMSAYSLASIPSPGSGVVHLGPLPLHAYGLAVDINPCENVYIEGGQVDPPRCAANADRSRQVPGLIHEGGVVTRAFDAIGWGWGGRWVTPKDYQHFSSNGH